MGKKGGRKGHSKGGKYGSEARKKFKSDDQFNEWEYNHPVFEAYYRLQFEETYFKDDPTGFDSFWSQMKEKLPVVFRINKLIPNYNVLLSQLKNENFLSSIIETHKKQIAEQNLLKASAESTEIKPAADQIEEEKVAENEEQNDNLSEKSDEQEGQDKVNGEAQDLDQPKRMERFEFSEEQLKSLTLTPISFYPDELVWQVNCNRIQLKKSRILKEFHRYLQRATDSGLISRQELVSMLPPLFLDVEANDIVFDMCAAPGSKTAQLLEIMAGKGGENTTGAVIANDVDQQRAYLLTHQVGRINPRGLVVINHPAQFFPQLMDEAEQNQKFYFDKVQADVPCSGDGATRKIPDQWKNWSPKDGQVLHPLQLAILQRALTLCKVGGYVLYSTCSLNPIEDEAVITEAFRRSNPDSIELIDINDKYPSLKGRRGLSTWKVYSLSKKQNEQQTPREQLKRHESMADVIPNEKSTQFLRSSMFPENEEHMTNIIKIQNTMRILPHDQDTGGFYIALIKKKSHIVWDKKGYANKTVEQIAEQLASNTDDLPDASEIPKEAERLQNIDQAGNDDQPTPNKPADSNSQQREFFAPISDDDWQNVQENYGFSGLTQQLFVNSMNSKQKAVRLITPGVHKFINCDTKGVVNIVNMGTKALERTKETFQGNQCRFRICQDSINLLGPYITKRKIEISEEDFKFFILNKNSLYKDMPNQELKDKIEALGQGTIILHCPSFNDYVVCQNFHSAVNIQTNKESAESLNIRYIENRS